MKAFPDLSIKRKVLSVIMLTSVSALVLMGASSVIYDAVTYRSNLVQHLNTSARILGDATTAMVTFRSVEEARQALAALEADPDVSAGALYDETGKLFAWYPAREPDTAFPQKPGPAGLSKQDNLLILYKPAIQGGKMSGTVFLKSDLRNAYARLGLRALITLTIIGASVLLVLFISNLLQQRITGPVLALVESARQVSSRGDYSLRAQKVSNDELGLLTDSFNAMLMHIEEQTQKLRDNEERLRLALESSRMATWDWNLRTNEMNGDALFYDLFAVDREKFGSTHEDFLKHVDPRDREKVTAACSAAIARKDQASIELRALLPEGGSRHLVCRGKATYSAAGEPLRMTGLLMDVTERRKAEEVRSFMAAIVDSSDDAVIGKDLESRVVSWNAGAERMFGYTAAEMVGQSVNRLISPDRPDEETRVVAEARLGHIHHFQTIRLRKDGHAIDVSVTVSPIRNSLGDIIGVSSIARDISEQQRAKESLERHAAILREQAQMLDLANVLGRDMEDHVILWNAGMEKMYGWTKEEALGRVSHELFRSILPLPLGNIREILFSAGRWEGELRHFRKDGRQIVVASQWVLHRDAEGRPAAILEVNNDVTERREAEDQVRRMNMELEERVQDRTMELRQANQELEAFTYSVAHDLRAPLRHVDAFSRILSEDFGEFLPAEAQRYLENIRQGSRNMSQLVDDLLNLARVGRQELKRRPTALNPIVEEVKQELERETKGREIKWRIARLPVLECDAGLIKQVFTNLLSNAVKYTRPRPVAQIEVGAQDRDGEATLYVRDNGVGFSMKYADKLFGVFQRLHRQEEFEGTGVGLATVDRIVRKHGGRVWAESSLGKGATFYFTAPALQNGPNGQSG
jgi:PAS domain S-box-containing protein